MALAAAAAASRMAAAGPSSPRQRVRARRRGRIPQEPPPSPSAQRPSGGREGGESAAREALSLGYPSARSHCDKRGRTARARGRGTPGKRGWAGLGASGPPHALRGAPEAAGGLRAPARAAQRPACASALLCPGPNSPRRLGG